MRAFLFTSLFAFGTVIAACSATGGNNQFNTTGTGGSGAGTGMGGDVNLGAGFISGSGSSSGGVSDGCSDAAKLVYVLSTDNAIWSFEPANKKFTQLFNLDCPTPNDGNLWVPNSMAVDRNAVAWVNYVGTDVLLGGDVAGKIYRVDITKKTCEATPAVNLPTDWFRLGMGYSTDMAGGTGETLYVSGTGATGKGLGRIDPSSKQLVQIGNFTGALTGANPELTGTGAAELYGFFTFTSDPTKPVHVAAIDKPTAATPSATDWTIPLSTVPEPLAWAFSFWGGGFYLYTSEDGTSASSVTRFDATTHTVDSSYALTAPMVIVGAGVSTCAPLTPPK